MNLPTSFRQLLNSFVVKPAPRHGWRAAVVLESLELRLNLSAVLIVETVDAYWLYDDVDSLIKAASDGQAENCSLSDPSSDFTPLELQVIDGLVAELIASEGYNDNDILAITYVDDTTSDELISNGYFDDFEATDTLGDSVESLSLTETTDVLFDFGEESPELQSAAGNDTILASDDNAPSSVIASFGDNLGAPAPNGGLRDIETVSRISFDGQLTSLIHEVEIPTDPNAITSVHVRNEIVTETRTTLSPNLVVIPKTDALSAVTRMAKASEWILPFAKFPSAVLASAGIASSLEYTTYLWSQHNASDADDSTHLETDDAGQFSYSQIAAAFGATGLAVARWLDSTREIGNALTVKQPLRQSRGTRQTSL